MPTWNVQYTDLFGNCVTESFNDERKAVQCYESLLPRTYGELGDLERVSVSKDEDGASAASLGACPTGGKDSKNVDEGTLDVSNCHYGDGDTIYTPTGADGQWPSRHDVICNMIMNNDADGLMESIENGFPDEYDPDDVVSFDDQYYREFKEDYSLVFKGKNINDALEVMLEYDPDFWLAPFDMMNLFHAGNKGCSPSVLSRMVHNFINDSDQGAEYVEYSDGCKYTWEDMLEMIPKE